jgi:hypothetical protein
MVWGSIRISTRRRLARSKFISYLSPAAVRRSRADLWGQKARWRQIEAFATQSEVRLLSEWLVPVGHKISAGDLAFNQYRMGSALPSDSVRHLTADAGLLGEDYSAAITSQPSDSVFHELGVSHGVSLLGDGGTWK